MIPRVLSSLVFFAVFLFGLYYSADWAGHIIFFVVAFGTVMGTREYYNLARLLKVRPSPWPGNAIALTFLVDAYFFQFEHFVHIFITCFWVLLITQVFLKSFNRAIINNAVSLFGSIYLGVPLAIVLFIFRHGTDAWALPSATSGSDLIVFLVLTSWATDIGGYCFGKPFGKHKMSPKLSPNKSWEGLVGGALLALVSGLILWYFWPDMSQTLRLVEAALVPVGFTVVGTIGDLAESAFKRDAGVKDSGQTFTGHGGMLDILDSLLLCAPVFYLYMSLTR
ncbi:MAG: phosphatidate cytidylyltransferase [Candidatus Sumerlaeota bacterium]